MMKKSNLLIFGMLISLPACVQPNKENATATSEKLSDSANHSNTANLSSTGSYSVSVKPVAGVSCPAIQSFICGRSGDNLLLIGGRTNGFHGTDGTDPAINFPASFANRNFIVYNPVTGMTKMAPLPSAYMDQLSSTNMQGCQSGDYLYGCGGYGPNKTGSYVTYNGFFAVNVPAMINAILNGQSNLSQYIMSTTVNDMAVTGGELLIMNGLFYLVMGQNFTGLYAPPPSDTTVQKYINEIRMFSVYRNPSLYARLVQRFTDGNRSDNTSRYHRRDLNVVQIINGDGKKGIAVYGGVFTQNLNGAWLNPVYILQGANNNPVVSIDNNFTQKLNQYGCAQVLVYDPAGKTMMTTLLGGISYYRYEDNNTLKPDPGMPFVKIISTITRAANGTTTESSSPRDTLPDFVGAESRFIPKQNLLMAGSSEIIDASKIPANGRETLVGYMFGGIKSTAKQSSTIYPTMANKTLYQVYVTRSAQ
jgi:hypothetical protein